jgi:hypothetical protein
MLIEEEKERRNTYSADELHTSKWKGFRPVRRMSLAHSRMMVCYAETQLVTSKFSRNDAILRYCWLWWRILKPSDQEPRGSMIDE